jgi:hypothetical protein
MKRRSPVRLVPLAGVVFAVLTILGDLVIGPLPDADANISKLTSFYAAHHGRIGAGGTLLGVAAIFLGVFGTAVWLRIRETGLHPVLAGAALVGTATTASVQLSGGANTYSILGGIGHEQNISPAALQAWHISGSAGGGIDGGIVLLLLAVAAAGIAGQAFPRWLAWPALALAILQVTPFGFVASLVTLAWAAVTGLVMFLRPAKAAPTTARDESTAPRHGSAVART